MRQIALSQISPKLSEPDWQLCTAAQFDDPAYERWRGVLHFPAIKNRKYWEWAYIMQALERHLGSFSGKSGLGFGVGKEPLASAFAAAGATVVATDLAISDSAAAGWSKGDQYASSLEDLQQPQICDRALFLERVKFREVNMNRIPADLAGFDFLWSSCALEHIGSLTHGVDFIERAMRCLKPGGIAVHTTEFNISSNDETIEVADLSLYRRKDILGLAERLVEAGYGILPVNFDAGDDPLDLLVDLPPYKSDGHIKLRFAQFDITSFGLIVINSDASTGIRDRLREWWRRWRGKVAG